MAKPVALIVNDDPSQLRLSSVVLEKGGFETRSCASADEALTLLSGAPQVDLIVTDLHMPGIDGFRFCRILRSPEYPACNDVPILVVSATFSGRDAETLSLELGASGFLSAPYAPSALQDYARALLSGRRPEPVRHVLIAVADAEASDRLREAFEEASYIVDVTRTAADTLTAWRSAQPDVLVLDDRLPDRPAAEVLAEVKAPGSPTVAVTLVNDGAAHEALTMARFGADASVLAPADPVRLVALAASATRQRSLIRTEELLEARSRSLRESEARWRALVEAIPEIVLVHDADGTIRHVNRAGAEQLGWPADEFVGRNLRDVEQAPRATRAPTSGDAVWLTRDGCEMPVEIVRRRLRFDGREALLTVAHDIRPRLERARQRQEFVSLLAHDVRNPLGVVLGFADLLGDSGDLNADQKDLLSRIQASATAALALIANYLHLTQSEAGPLAIHRRPVPLAGLIETVVEQVRGLAARGGVTLDLTLAADLGEIAADAGALDRALSNLVHNAVKFTPSGGRVAVAARREDDRVLVEIADTGVGIAPDRLDSIFQPYREGKSRQLNEGTGLGLFVARALVAAHGGELAIASAPGQGTTVTVRLPVAAAAEA